MQVVLTDEVETIVAGLLGGISTNSGPTAEQLTVLDSITRHLWGRSDIDVHSVTPLSSAEVAKALARPEARHRFAEIMMTLELCRHPMSKEQVDLAEEYVAALGIDDVEIEITRTAIVKGAEAAATDLERFYQQILPEISEISLRDRYLRLDKPDPALTARLRKLRELPEESLGYQYLEFYRRNNIELPGDDIHVPAYYVSHDMIHVITGYEPTAPGEIARSGFLLAANDSHRNWLDFLVTMSIHESGVLNYGDSRAKVATLDRAGVPELLGEGLERGVKCTVDLNQVDHLAIAHLPLEQVREDFSVVPLRSALQ
ncbi:hypothetical protein [Mycolicibacterium sp.]|jgi:hypothetical protein|uniref:hypothetical protein n=1 Tax=Mycolicibacterium sp. TaxID=2320850 RepID=UPI001A22EEE3|nr:hypothetical protein [Mycolicibacterium sp.]MBJ7401658.1 hypothetical protein [Mycolicibacterium sp.]